uniref:Ribosomal protein L7Ae/L30e/S12e/Gadd45 domain-containing protein n=1 Tax=Solanum lycopersicum TaxID=4081 RepID=A0A3Q7IWT2_SOLLC
MLIAHDVDPIKLVVYVKGKARLGSIVHKKTASALCLTTVKYEDKMKKSGGDIMGSKSHARTKAKERVLAKEAAHRLN